MNHANHSTNAAIAPGAVTLTDVQLAARRIAGLVEHTEVRREAALDARLGCELWLKCEQLQATGAFKLRGASNAVARLEEQGLAGDVATHSSGNHGAALALAASRAGRQAQVVMPANSVPGKIAAVRRCGGEVILCEPNQAAREQGLAELVAQGLHAVPPYDHPDIIAGQGTAALELLSDHPFLDVLVTPLGGGGLLAGSAIAARGLSPAIEVIGAEPAGAADGAASFQSGRRVEHWQPETIADGLRGLIGKLNFDLIKANVDDILLADEDGIVTTMRLLYETTGMALEPSAAVAIAVISAHPQRFAGKRVGVILSGQNYDPALFPWLQRTP
jgi:threonine dehydratase